MKTIIVYLPLDPEKAKRSNLPVRLPVLIEDLDNAVKENKLTKDAILRGLEAQVRTGKDLDYYLSYYVYHLYDRAREYMNKREYTQAREYVEKAAKYKKDYRYPFHLGIIEREEGNLETSELLLKEAVSSNDDFVPARLELARTLLAEGEVQEAIKACSEIFQIDPNFTLAYVVMGDAYLKMGDAKSAISLYRQALRIDPSLPSVHWRIGVAANTLQKFSLAQKELRTAISKQEGGWQARYNLAYTLFRLGKIMDSLNILRSLWQEGIENPEVLTELVIEEKLLGLYEEALEFVQMGFEMNVKEKGFLLASIDVYAFNGLFEKALSVEGIGDEFETRRMLVKMEKRCECQLSLEKIIKEVKSEDENLRKRLKEIRNGILPREEFFDEEVLSVFPKIVKECGRCPYTCERLLTQSGWALTGSVEGVALLLFLYRIYLVKEDTPDLKEAVESAAVSIGDISWKVGKALSLASQNDLYDLEEEAKKRSERPSEVAVFFYMATRILDGHPDVASFIDTFDLSRWKAEILKILLD